jgi:hypothetical protein
MVASNKERAVSNRAIDKIKCVRIIIANRDMANGQPKSSMAEYRMSVFRSILRRHDSILMRRHIELHEALSQPDHMDIIDRLRNSAMLWDDEE